MNHVHFEYEVKRLRDASKLNLGWPGLQGPAAGWLPIIPFRGAGGLCIATLQLFRVSLSLSLSLSVAGVESLHRIR